MFDPTPRWIKILDAVSQLANVAFLPAHADTCPNESISGRAHREGWVWAERLIDLACLPFDGWGHCAAAHKADLDRARRFVALYGDV